VNRDEGMAPLRLGDYRGYLGYCPGETVTHLVPDTNF
jgi:hypothetical protein